MSFILLVTFSCLKKIPKHFRKNPSETVLQTVLPTLLPIKLTISLQRVFPYAVPSCIPKFYSLKFSPQNLILTDMNFICKRRREKRKKNFISLLHTPVLWFVVDMLLIGFNWVSPKPSASVESSLLLLQSFRPYFFVSWNIKLHASSLG